jgi:hypothetical protein
MMKYSFVHHSHIELAFSARLYGPTPRGVNTDRGAQFAFSGQKAFNFPDNTQSRESPLKGMREKASEFLIMEVPACGIYGRWPWPLSPCHWWWEPGA